MNYLAENELTIETLIYIARYVERFADVVDHIEISTVYSLNGHALLIINWEKCCVTIETIDGKPLITWTLKFDITDCSDRLAYLAVIVADITTTISNYYAIN